MSKTYVGKGWLKKFANGGAVINISLKLDELKKLSPNQYGDIKLIVGELKAKNEKTKATHWVAVDEYVKSASASQNKQSDNTNDIPF